MGLLLVAVLVVGTSNAWSIDGDRTPAVRELQIGTDPLAADTDGDSLDDTRELRSATDALRPDTDGDGLDDGRERLALPSDPTRADTDGDGLSDRDEAEYETDPTREDSDGDGLSDREEIDGPTEPTVADTDGDGLGNGDEVTRHGTDPTQADTDGNRLSDGRELDLPTDPLDRDSDDDGLWVRRELNGETSPVDADTDGDPLSDAVEVNGLTDPTNPDTDGDGLRDHRELRVLKSDPAVADTDGALPGADPLQIDVYVSEASDQRSSGIEGYEQVERWFDEMQVENLDGSDGIEFHLVAERSIEARLTYTGQNFYPLKDRYHANVTPAGSAAYHTVLFTRIDIVDGDYRRAGRVSRGFLDRPRGLDRGREGQGGRPRAAPQPARRSRGRRGM